MISIQDLFINLGFKTDEKSLNQLNQNLNKTSKSITDVAKTANDSELAINNMNDNFNHVKDTIFGVADKVALLGVAFLGAMGVSANYSDSLGHLAKRAGMAVGDLDALGYATGQAGGDANAARQNIAGLNTALYEAQFGAGGLGDGLAELGISLYDSNNQLKDSKSIIYQVSDAIQGMSRGKQMSLISQMGLSGISDLLLEGSASIQSMETRLKSLGIVSDSNVAISQEFNDTLDDFWHIVKSITRTITDAFLPTITSITKSFNEFWIANKEIIEIKLKDYLDILGDALEFVAIAIGAIIATKFVLFLGSMVTGVLALGKALFLSGLKGAGLLALFAALFLIAEDIYAHTQGKDSVFGRLIEGFNQLRQSSQVVNVIASGFELLLSAINEAAEGAKILFDMFTGKRDFSDLGKGLLATLTLAIDKIKSLLKKFGIEFEEDSVNDIEKPDIKQDVITNAINRIQEGDLDSSELQTFFDRQKIDVNVDELMNMIQDTNKNDDVTVVDLQNFLDDKNIEVDANDLLGQNNFNDIDNIDNDSSTLNDIDNIDSSTLNDIDNIDNDNSTLNNLVNNISTLNDIDNIDNDNSTLNNLVNNLVNNISTLNDIDNIDNDNSTLNNLVNNISNSETIQTLSDATQPDISDIDTNNLTTNSTNSETNINKTNNISNSINVNVTNSSASAEDISKTTNDELKKLYNTIEDDNSVGVYN